jgi:hypothetical protein
VKRLIKEAEASNDITSLRIDQKDKNHGMTPLRRAAMNGRAGCVRHPLRAGADVKVLVNDKKDRPTLMLAYENWAIFHKAS